VTESADTAQTFTTPSEEAVASFLPELDHASAVTKVLWLGVPLELVTVLRMKSLLSGAGAVPGRLLMGTAQGCREH
jgi:hypothetical protein